MTPRERESFEDWLVLRFKAARTTWEQAKQTKPAKLELSLDAPSPDGTLMRAQARALPELTQYMNALRDLTAFSVYGQYPPELLAEWRAAQTPERKPFEKVTRFERRKQA